MRRELALLLGLMGCGYDFERFHAALDGSSAQPSTADRSSDADAPRANAVEDAAAPALDAGRATNADAAPERTDAAADSSAPSATESLPEQQPDATTCSPQAGQSCSCDPTLCDAQTPTQAVSGLRVRYDFSGAGSTVSDRVGSAHGRAQGGAALDGSGSLQLDGADDYVDLPDRLLAGLGSVTIVTWVERFDPICWQRVFDFGMSDAGEGAAGNSDRSFALALSSCDAMTTVASARRGELRDVVENGRELLRGDTVQLAVAFDGTRKLLTLYIEGLPAGEAPLRFSLRDLEGTNNWLGRSQWQHDPHARLRYDEFRLYERVLSAQEVALLFERGADAP